jgi:hypothetical protein
MVTETGDDRFDLGGSETSADIGEIGPESTGA